MPTKKRRVGFIPRNDVLDIINKLSYENNLSYSKIINILVEEALLNRGLFNIKNRKILNKENLDDFPIKISDKINNENNRLDYNFKKTFHSEKNLNFTIEKEELLDDDIYDKFLMFLKFKEKMKKKNM